MMNSSSNSARMSSGNNRFPFTPSQWQELEHQALVFKYMVSGMPVPTDLLFTIRRSLDSSLSSKFLLHQPHHIGWNGYQVGFGRKIDPEPGRCRRTDGKKWRCSKEAYPDSKYCERHMHRGRNRSRKLVEINNNHNHNHNNNNNIPSTTTTTTNNVITTTKTATSPPPTKSATESSHFPYPHFTSSKGVSHHHESTTNFFLESNAYSHSSVKDYRDAMKGESDELLSFGTMRNSLNNNDSSWELSPVLTMGSSTLMSNSQMKLHNKADDHQYSSYSGLQSLNDINSAIQQKKHYYNLERDFDDDQQQQPTRKVMHHFIDEGPPQKDKDSSSSSSTTTNWLINSHHHHHEDINKMSSHHKTQLSMSIPNPMHDFFMTQKW